MKFKDLQPGEQFTPENWPDEADSPPVFLKLLYRWQLIRDTEETKRITDKHKINRYMACSAVNIATGEPFTVSDQTEVVTFRHVEAHR